MLTQALSMPDAMLFFFLLFILLFLSDYYLFRRRSPDIALMSPFRSSRLSLRYARVYFSCDMRQSRRVTPRHHALEVACGISTLLLMPCVCRRHTRRRHTPPSRAARQPRCRLRRVAATRYATADATPHGCRPSAYACRRAAGSQRRAIERAGHASADIVFVAGARRRRCHADTTDFYLIFEYDFRL